MTPAGRMEAQKIETLVRRWADAVHAGDLDTVVEDHADDIVMFDVPPPDEGVRWLAAYRDLWPPFLEAMRAASTAIVVAAGAESEGELANRGALAVDERLGRRAGGPQQPRRLPCKRIRPDGRVRDQSSGTFWRRADRWDG